MDLATALRAGDDASAALVAQRIDSILSPLEETDSLLQVNTQIRKAIDRSPPDLARARRELALMEQELEGLEPQSRLLVGKWAGAANAALLANAEIFFKSRHWAQGLDLVDTEENSPELRDLAKLLRKTSSGDLEGIKNSLDQIFSLFGSQGSLGEGPTTG